MYVCICKAVTESTLDDVLAAGADDLEAIADRCGAGTRCGTCVPLLRELLAGRSAHLSHCAA